MSRRTKKVGIAGRLGARYGVRVRKRITEIEKTEKLKYNCPQCLSFSVKRTSTGVWQCRHCDLIFAGGAYTPVVTKGITREEPIEEEKEQAATKPEEMPKNKSSSKPEKSK